MKALSMILIFGGYMLVYAATAKQGKFATEPWAGLFADAYDTGPDGTTTIRQTASGPAPVPAGFSPLVTGAQSGLPAG